MSKTYLSRIVVFFILFSVITMGASAQLKKGTIKAKLIDAATKQPVEFGSVSISTVKDSTVVRSSVSDKTGVIEFTGLALGSYRLTIYQLGLKTVKMPFELTAAKPYAELGDVIMEASVRNLKEVNIDAERAPVTIKKDTVEFNAGSYKTQKNDNVEQLLKKLPGVDVDKDGKITAQGKEVTKMLVDGKEFFGNDPKAVTKNLPADAIAKVQLIDDKTENAKKTGIDDGQREKVINVTLKEDKKHGWFGNMAAAGGSTDRYLGQFNMNHFNKTMQFSILSLSNNINEAGFSYDDINNFANGNAFSTFASSDGSSSINIGANGRADINGAFSGVSGGLITNHTGGLNYSDEFGKGGKLKFNTNFVTVISKNTLNKTSDLQDIPNNLFTNQLSNGNNTSNSYRLNVNLDYKIDSLNTIGFKPAMSVGYKKNYASSVSGTINALADSVNSIRQLLNQTTTSPAFGGQLYGNHRFHQGKGSLNLNINGNYSASNADYNNQALSKYYTSSSTNSKINQQASQDNNVSFLTGTASFVRLLNKAKKINMNLSQSFDVRRQNADQYTVDYNAVTGKYEVLDPLYTGNSQNNNHRYATTLGISKTGDLLNLGVNMAVAQLGLHGTSVSNNVLNDVSRNTWAFVPNAYANYHKANGPSMYFSVGTNVSLPSATDLQTVYNNTNPLYIRQGNPDLVQSRTLYGNFNYNFYDAKSNRYVNVYSNYSTTWNGFATTSTVDASGITTSKPINVDGNYNFSLGFNIGKPTKIKGLKYSVGSYSSLNHNINFINGNRNEVTRVSPGFNASTTLDKDKYHFTYRFYGSYNTANNSYQHLADQHYFNLNNTASGNALPFKTWCIFSDITQSAYRGQAGSNTTYYLWNAGIEHYFLKDQNLTVQFNAFDLLNQNSGIQRSISTTGIITNNLTNTLGQYFYLKLIYKINKVGASKSNNNGLIIFR